MRKELSTKQKARRPSALHENPELGKVAAQAGVFKIGDLARRIGRSDLVVAQVLRREKRAEPTEHLIAEVFGITRAKLLKICERQPPQAAAA